MKKFCIDSGERKIIILVVILNVYFLCIVGYLLREGFFWKNGVFFEKWLMLFKNDEWGWSFIVIVGDKSYNLILNDVEIKDGLECFDFK